MLCHTQRAAALPEPGPADRPPDSYAATARSACVRASANRPENSSIGAEKADSFVRCREGVRRPLVDRDGLQRVVARGGILRPVVEDAAQGRTCARACCGSRPRCAADLERALEDREREIAFDVAQAVAPAVDEQLVNRRVAPESRPVAVAGRRQYPGVLRPAGHRQSADSARHQGRMLDRLARSRWRRGELRRAPVAGTPCVVTASAAERLETCVGGGRVSGTLFRDGTVPRDIGRERAVARRPRPRPVR